MGDLISIIIPIYNSEKYLNECIESVLAQTYKYFEIILVDDGSSDHSREICEKKSLEDRRIQYHWQEHEGVSAARNAGIEAAKGKYLFFLDSDDIIHPQVLEWLYILSERENVVLAAESYCLKLDDLKKSEEPILEKDYTHLGKDAMMWEFIKGENGGLNGIGGKMIRRDAVKNVSFDKVLIRGEDTKFIYQLIVEGADAVILHKDWYYYRKHENKKPERDRIEIYQSIYRCLRFICDQEKEYSRIENAKLLEKYIIECMINWRVQCREAHDNDALKYLQKLADTERKIDIFLAIDKRYQKDFSLLFFCYPFYLFNSKMTEVFEIKKRKQKQKKEKEMEEKIERERILGILRQLYNEKKEVEKKVSEEVAEVKFDKGREEKELEKKKRFSTEKISVIIPMYNTEQFIGQCIRSVRNQTHANLEIIIVDDGSTDRGAAICRSMCRYDYRIQIIKQKNKGVSSARNRGLELASGKYVFFLDSDDAIHPLLLEELLDQAEEYQVGIALCEYQKGHAIWMEEILKKVSENDARPKWQIIEKEESEEWIHVKYASALMRVGALVRRDLIGEVRFNEDLIYGEDTLFMYHLICKQISIAYSTKAWYYYRMHTESATHSLKVMKDQRYFNVYRILRDSEYKRMHINFSMIWERRLVWLMRQRFTLMKERKDKDGCMIIKEQALIERRQLLFKKLPLMPKLLFLCCFLCYPLYYFVLEKFARNLDKVVWGIRARLEHKNGK